MDNGISRHGAANSERDGGSKAMRQELIDAMLIYAWATGKTYLPDNLQPGVLAGFCFRESNADEEDADPQANYTIDVYFHTKAGTVSVKKPCSFPAETYEEAVDFFVELIRKGAADVPRSVEGK